MKIFCKMIAAMLLGSLVAKADSKVTDDWSKILSAGVMVHIEQPKGSNVFGMAGFFEACVDGNQFRSITKQPFCVQEEVISEGGGQEGPGPLTECVKKAYEYVYLPMTSTTQVCVKYKNSSLGQEDGGGASECVAWKEQIDQLSNVLTFRVNKITFAKEGFNSKFLFKKDYTVPACN